MMRTMNLLVFQGLLSLKLYYEPLQTIEKYTLLQYTHFSTTNN